MDTERYGTGNDGGSRISCALNRTCFHSIRQSDWSTETILGGEYDKYLAAFIWCFYRVHLSVARLSMPEDSPLTRLAWYSKGANHTGLTLWRVFCNWGSCFLMYAHRCWMGADVLCARVSSISSSTALTGSVSWPFGLLMEKSLLLSFPTDPSRWNWTLPPHNHNMLNANSAAFASHF